MGRKLRPLRLCGVMGSFQPTPMESPAKLSLENALRVSEESCNAWKTAHEQTCKQVAELSAKAHCLQAELTAEKNNVASLKREVERLTSVIHLIPYYPNVATPQTEEAFDGHNTRKLTAPSSKDGNQEQRHALERLSQCSYCEHADRVQSDDTP